MFHFKEKVFLGVILVLIIGIPSGSFLLSQRFKAQDKPDINPNATPVTQAKEVPKTLSKKTTEATKSASASSDSGSIALVGPSLAFKLNIEGRPKDKMASKVFVGIAQGSPDLSTQPEYLLSFNVDVPESGSFSGISLAGLNSLETYTAILKGSTQIATSSAFTVKPTTSDIGTVNLLTGDVNDDNVINASDFSIVKNAIGQTPSSQNWNPALDFNKDNLINNFDLSHITKNYGKVGTTGAWYSKTVPVATGSAGLKQSTNLGGPNIEPIKEFMKIPGEGGSWLWVPE